MAWRRKSVGLLLALLADGACIASGPATYLRECETTADCDGGLVCHGDANRRSSKPKSVCTKPCAVDRDCPLGGLGCPEVSVCTEGFCAELLCID
ncbi:MAG: hypothetical protein H6747_01225 [Deltaproteobacteria bacterium]|nr:hypothetical protein [Deltaproteobacteria bacterium]